MNPLAAVAAAAGLGLAGFDPFGAFIAISALAAGGRIRAVLAFFVTAAASTIVVGTLLGETVHAVTAWIATNIVVPDPLRFGVQVVAALALAVWTVLRIRRGTRAASKDRRRTGAGIWAMMLLGLLWGVSALTDPSFYAVAALPVGGLWAMAGLITVWFLVSQSPLVAFTLVLGAGRRSAPVRRMTEFIGRLAGPSAVLMTVFLGVAAVLIAANAATWPITGSFLPF
ncbi:hypothetical protein [Agromyces archimandritae]|uniref:Uncharacterized protein n=1 Tax=Agromyces archimandritae TaxID=2781962 RepID=A0A975FLM2_9MICO|nr:hypothetical protein [Agromyces archimandritae]QTX04374.1 hypothetical protein G127AT_14040 [Agromyces archimandritae]